MRELTVEEMEQIQGGSLFGLHWSKRCLMSMATIVGLAASVALVPVPIGAAAVVTYVAAGINRGIDFADACIYGS